MTRLKQILAGILLLILGFAIIPPESFHHHEESHVICKKGDIHVELKSFECDLFNFVFPVLIQNNQYQGAVLKQTLSLFLVENTRPALGVFFSKPYNRGPPLLD